MQILRDQRCVFNIQSKMPRPNKRREGGTETKGRRNKRGTDDTDLKVCRQGPQVTINASKEIEKKMEKMDKNKNLNRVVSHKKFDI